MAAKTSSAPAGRPDVLIIALTVALVLTGFIAVYSASFVIALARFGDPNYYIVRHIVWATGGAILLIAAARTDYRILRPLAVPLMLITIALLIAVLVAGQEAGGARRWIGVGELSLQPAEFAKLSVIIYMAAWLSSKGDDIRSLEHGLLPFTIIIGTVSFLIMMQPNMGTTLIILAITLTMFWTAGASIVQMLALASIGIGSMTALAMVEGYRLNRISAFLDAESDPLVSGFQTLQSLIAMGNGGISGLGLGASRSKFFYIPESHTDGVFAIIGEEAGLIATLTIVLIFVLFMVRGYTVSIRARDDFGSLLGVGITTWIAVQALLNIGGITRVIPLTGVPLPFLSFGSNSLAAVMMAVGVLLSVSRYGRNSGEEPEREPRRAGVVTRRRRQ